jgi:hypothetical protein
LRGVRSIPSLSFKDLIKMTPIALLNIVGHVLTVNAMFQKGGGSFTHVIKASEPVVNVVLAFFMYGAVPKPLTALSLLPITYGVAYASTLGSVNIINMQKELSSPVAIMAMGSNIAFAIRSALRKGLNADFRVSHALTVSYLTVQETIYLGKDKVKHCE